MTTATKLQGILNSKAAIKAAIAAGGAFIDDDTILADYAQKIDDLNTTCNDVIAYATTIGAGGGVVISVVPKLYYNLLLNYGWHERTILALFPSAGVKKRVDGINEYAEALFDLSASGDHATQSTERFQPYLSKGSSEYAWGASSSFGGALTLPNIAITETCTVIKAYNSLSETGVNISFTEISSGTLTEIEWTGDLFYYGIRTGAMTPEERAIETAWLEGWITPIDESLYQGLKWTQESTTYARLGSIKTIPVGQSAGNENLPIHSQMARCLQLDNGDVNYFINPAEPINKTGVVYVTTGNTTSAATDKLIDSGKDFVALGVVAGMTVRNVSTGKIAVIYSVTATELTLSRDYFTSGVAYQIGSANYGGPDGQVTVRIPKFYVRQEYFNNDIYWAISLQQLAGFQLHPAFIKDGVEVDYRYYSAFEGSMYDASAGAMTAKESIHLNLYETGDKFCSVAGQWPKTAETWQEYDSGSEARGTGWRNIDFALNSAVQLLYLIEYASFQSQAMIGAGRTNLSGGSFIADSYIGQTGYSIKNGNNTASVQVSGTGGYLTDYMSYRGIENWYGNSWKILSFIAWDGRWTGTTAPQSVYWTNDVSKKKYDSSTGMTPLTNASYIGALEGYQSAFENQFAFIPSKIGSSSVVGDYYWQYNRLETNTWRLVLFGGSATHGGRAGGFTLSEDSGWAVTGASIGARLAY